MNRLSHVQCGRVQGPQVQHGDVTAVLPPRRAGKIASAGSPCLSDSYRQILETKIVGTHRPEFGDPLAHTQVDSPDHRRLALQAADGGSR